MSIRHIGSTLNKFVASGYVLSPSVSSHSSKQWLRSFIFLWDLLHYGLPGTVSTTENTVLNSEYLVNTEYFLRSTNHRLSTSFSNEFIYSKQNYTYVYFKTYFGN